MSNMTNRFRAFSQYIFGCCCSHIPQRFVMVGLSAAALFVCYYQRHTSYQGLNNIIDHRSIEDHPSNSRCPRMLEYRGRNRDISLKDYQPWKPVQIKGITHSFFAGFLVSLIPGGVVADLYGAKSMMAIGVTVSTVTTVLFPVLVEMGPLVFASARFLQGLAQGLVFPATSTITGHWVPASERTIATGIIRGHLFFGWAAAYWAHKAYAEYFISWHVQFYVCGLLGGLWLIFCILFAFSDPFLCPYISEAELKWINSSSDEYDEKLNSKPLFVPWKEIVCSRPVHALIVINLAGSCIHYTMILRFKHYLMDVIGLTHKLSYNAVEMSHFVLGVSEVVLSFPSDWLVNHAYMSRTTSRKLYTIMSNVMMIPCMAAILIGGCHGTVVTSSYLALCFCRGPFYIGTRSNAVDLNPHFAGTVDGIIQSTACVIALFSWDFFTFIVPDISDMSQWTTLFLILSAILLFLSLPYLWFGSAKVQQWGISELRDSHLEPGRSVESQNKRNDI